jgi:dTDP-4-dehydrorhamnose reductase
MKILVLGITGMLGSMVFRYLSEKMPGEVDGWRRPQLLVSDFIREPFDLVGYDYIVNCIGEVHKNADAQDLIEVNALFPQILANFTAAKIIHPSTDCVFSGEDGYYNETSPTDAHDNYGKSKALGESSESNVLNIRCSLIGPGGGLLQWFLDNKDAVVSGYRQCFWNGVTTLQFAQLCYEIIQQNAFDEIRNINHIHHLVCNDDIDKAFLLVHINGIYGMNKEIVSVNEPICNRILRTKYNALENYCPRKSVVSAIEELRMKL